MIELDPHAWSEEDAELLDFDFDKNMQTLTPLQKMHWLAGEISHWSEWNYAAQWEQGCALSLWCLLSAFRNGRAALGGSATSKKVNADILKRCDALSRDLDGWVGDGPEGSTCFYPMPELLVLKQF